MIKATDSSKAKSKKNLYDEGNERLGNISNNEVFKLLDDLGDVGRKPLHESREISWLILTFTQNMMRNRNSLPSFTQIAEILRIAGFDEPSAYLGILVKALKPISKEYTGTRYEEAFSKTPCKYAIEKAFLDNEHKIVSAVLAAINESLDKQIEKNIWNLGSINDRLSAISRSFQLRKQEEELLLFCLVMETSMEFFSLASSNSDTNNQSEMLMARKQKEINSCACFFSFKRHFLEKMLADDSKLKTLFLIESGFGLSPEIKEFLLSSSSSDLSDSFLNYWQLEPIPFERREKLERDIEIIKNILVNKAPDKCLNILIGGAGDSNKMGIVSHLAKALNLTTIKAKKRNDEDAYIEYQNRFRIKAIYLAQKNAENHKNGAVLIPNADHLLVEKEILRDSTHFGRIGGKLRTHIMDKVFKACNGVQLWLVDSLDSLDPFLCHYFDYVIKYVHRTETECLQAWVDAATKHGLSKALPLTELKKLNSNYKVNEGTIDSIFRNSSSLPSKGWDTESLISHIEQLLAAQRLLNSKLESF